MDGRDPQHLWCRAGSTRQVVAGTHRQLIARHLGPEVVCHVDHAVASAIGGLHDGQPAVARAGAVSRRLGSCRPGRLPPWLWRHRRCYASRRSSPSLPQLSLRQPVKRAPSMVEPFGVF